MKCLLFILVCITQNIEGIFYKDLRKKNSMHFSHCEGIPKILNALAFHDPPYVKINKENITNECNFIHNVTNVTSGIVYDWIKIIAQK